ncbi:MAG: glutathione peroxidase [Bacteriovoracaceae bacterium]|nr:glutathione peroxidase [Bacteriovoracaceae bacterium]
MNDPKTNSIYDFQVKNAQGDLVSLSNFKGKVLLIVNVASKCGYTNQYEGLELLQKEYAQKDFSVLAFPCNQFGGQEPGSDTEIQSFCQLTYHTTFPVLAKIDVNGSAADPLYSFLKAKLPGLLGTEMVKWNFTKFLVDKNGQPVKRFAPQDTPLSIKSEIEILLK